MQCAPFLRTLNPCVLCATGQCIYNSVKPGPFQTLFRHLNASTVVGCDGAQCVWEHVGVFRQELQCDAGMCVDDQPHLK